MKATGFTRNHCTLNGKQITYKKLVRGYRCDDCGGRLVEFPPSGVTPQRHVACGRCGGHKFTHELRMQREKAEASEVMEGLPAELQKAIGLTKNKPQIFSLAPVEIEI